MESKVVIFDHPLISHKLSIIRDKNTNTKDFRETVKEVATLMAYEVTRDLPTHEITVETPVETAKCETLNKDIVIVPILRAGMGMGDGIYTLIPQAKMGYIGLYRDEETLQPQLYYAKFPKNIDTAHVILCDPMLATGGTVVAALNVLKARGAKDIIYVGLVGVQEGIDAVVSQHPDVPIFLAAKDDHLNEKGYIVPGLGDCGDRLFGTK